MKAAAVLMMVLRVLCFDVSFALLVLPRYIGVFGGIVALLELIAFVCSCCLLGTAKRAKSRSFVDRDSAGETSSFGSGSYSQARP